MDDLREKVIKGLKHCSCRSGCNSLCPYYPILEDHKLDIGACTSHLAADALSLLKEQEPRVMTLEDNQISIASQNLVPFTWVEEKGRDDIYIAMCNDYRHYSDLPRAMRLTRFSGNGKTVSGCDYGKTWRCWTSLPTDEQREAVKWDADVAHQTEMV